VHPLFSLGFVGWCLTSLRQLGGVWLLESRCSLNSVCERPKNVYMFVVTHCFGVEKDQQIDST
jgi:hypothetical protein